MLETGQYYGAYREGRLVSVAGVHVYDRPTGPPPWGTSPPTRNSAAKVARVP
jgi:hypothetical protein